MHDGGGVGGSGGPFSVTNMIPSHCRKANDYLKNRAWVTGPRTRKFTSLDERDINCKEMKDKFKSHINLKTS